MACPNCELFHKVCQAKCCGPVPINGAIFRANTALWQRPVKEIMDFGIDVLPITEDLTCVFLSPEYKCMIYEKRPDVCQKFGDETHPALHCAYQTKDGKARTKKETKTILKQTAQKINTFF